ncbi:MAG: twin-arginine translocation signal domain-containing protein [Treponema sp.]|nr:twin-arginine translocation signal domain-containing protein [Treponema sp.]
MALSRRDFIKGGIAAAGAAALGGFGLTRSLHAGGVPERADGFTGSPGAEAPRSAGTRYVDLARTGELERREQALWALYDSCRLCPRECRANRSAGQAGVCSAAGNFRVASFGPHHGEETPLRGTRGSGTIFLSNCNLLCVFCQNWQIAHRGDGRETSHAELANMMLDLQRRGCHNINFVTPTHLTPHLVRAVRIAAAGGLHIPLLYNTGAYDSLEVIRLLDGIIDIYLPDFKFQDSAAAARFAQAQDYPIHAAAAIREMHRQVGFLQITGGVAQRGVLIRHLVMPENLAGTDAFVRWVVSELGSDTHVNIMSQYRPMFRANDYPPLNRRITQAEFTQAMRWAQDAGLRNFH